MRPVLLFLLIPLLLTTACRGTQPYTALDLQQVRQGYTELPPTYYAFRAAFKRGDAAGMKAEFHQEQRECRLMDKVDARDTIDPNVNLFQASYALDVLCNAIEQVYAIWRKEHHLPYDKTQTIIHPEEVFLFSDEYAKKLPKWMRRPAALA